MGWSSLDRWCNYQQHIKQKKEEKTQKFLSWNWEPMKNQHRRKAMQRFAESPVFLALVFLHFSRDPLFSIHCSRLWCPLGLSAFVSLVIPICKIVFLFHHLLPFMFPLLFTYSLLLVCSLLCSTSHLPLYVSFYVPLFPVHISSFAPAHFFCMFQLLFH